jgi:HEAT repeat protein
LLLLIDVPFQLKKNRNPDVRQLSAWALGELGDTSAVKPLSKLLQDEDEVVRKIAQACQFVDRLERENRQKNSIDKSKK